MTRAMIVEDEENLRLSIRRTLERASCEVVEASGVDDAWRRSRGACLDVVITDINLGDRSGLELIGRLRDDGFDGAVIAISGYGTIETAVEAMKIGADDYVQKPLSLEELSMLVERTIRARRDGRRLRLYERAERTCADEMELIGRSEPWLRALRMAEKLAAVPLSPGCGGADGHPLPTVLLLGETGAGKGVLARRIHQVANQNTRRNGSDQLSPFVHVNCASLPQTLIESELFGHEKGAFTDAKAARQGLFEMAEGGVIFLDEVGEMSFDLQARLLLVLEQGRFRRVGGTAERRVNARVIAATNQDLETRVESGAFRRDLFYRLNAFTIHAPPLRDRGDDVLALAEHMLEKYTRELRRRTPQIGSEAKAALRRHSWPGNVRELLNTMQRVAMLCEKPVVEVEDLALPRVFAQKAPRRTQTADELVFDLESGRHTAESVERALILQAIRDAGGNVTRAAKLVGMNRSSFRYRIQRFGIEGEVERVGTS